MKCIFASLPVSDESRRNKPQRRRQLWRGAQLHSPRQRAELGGRPPASRGGAAVLGPPARSHLEAHRRPRAQDMKTKTPLGKPDLDLVLQMASPQFNKMISIFICVGNGPVERHTSVFIDYQLLKCPDLSRCTHTWSWPSLRVIQHIFQTSCFDFCLTPLPCACLKAEHPLSVQSVHWLEFCLQQWEDTANFIKLLVISLTDISYMFI